MQIVIFRGIESAPNFHHERNNQSHSGQYMKTVLTVSPVFLCHCRWGFREVRHDTRYVFTILYIASIARLIGENFHEANMPRCTYGRNVMRFVRAYFECVVHYARSWEKLSNLVVLA